MTATRWSVPLVLVVFALGDGRADAQQRAGLMGGVSFGAGALNVSGTASDPAAELVGEAVVDQGVDVGFNMYLGVSTSPRTAVLFELALAGLGANRITFPFATSSHTSLVLAGALQYSPILADIEGMVAGWARGGNPRSGSGGRGFLR